MPIGPVGKGCYAPDELIDVGCKFFDFGRVLDVSELDGVPFLIHHEGVRRSSPLETFFYQTASGREPVLEWLQSLTKAQKFRIGVDIWKIQSEWPVGMPHVRALGKGLYEIRSALQDGIARLIFMVDGDVLVLLHGFIKKTQKTPQNELTLAVKRKSEYDQSTKR